MRECRLCGKSKADDDFSPGRARCKTCRVQKQQERYWKNRTPSGKRSMRHGVGGRLIPNGVVSLADREADFWALVEKTDGCWTWRGKRNPRHEYGQFYVGWDGSRYVEMRAHRAAWSLANKQPLPKGAHVLHECDNPICVRPEHLKLGTGADNMRDAASRGRLYWQKAVALAEKVDGLFTWEDVDALRTQADALELSYAFVVAATGGPQTTGVKAIADRFRSLADRLAALLPPRGP